MIWVKFYGKGKSFFTIYPYQSIHKNLRTRFNACLAMITQNKVTDYKKYPLVLRKRKALTKSKRLEFFIKKHFSYNHPKATGGHRP
ncbi:hypothetical protein FUAX_00080 [Fulvitalea axinellae]|uniref:Uncharacterized protein n=1 Tax=Fulvitalea axinellae TaxID=1182444 RepID=A0AAU9CFS1_9BACT|nr:hypothetical protein FUAX_00080 [Fulvitalea axinellae]